VKAPYGVNRSNFNQRTRRAAVDKGLVFSNAKVGQRQRALAEKFHEAGLLSAEGLKAVMAGRP